MKSYQRHGRPVRAFVPAEDEIIEWLRVHGWPHGDIAAYVGRAKSSVQKRLDTLAAHAEAAEEEAAPWPTPTRM